MKAFITYGFVLFFIVAIACGILALVNSKTAPIIAQNKIIAENNARNEVFPQATVFNRRNVENSFEYYEALDAENSLLGYTFIVADYGYSGVIETMVGLNLDMSINKIMVISQSETPGLGANCTKESFLDKFLGLTETDLKVNKDGGTIEAITGATITSRTIINSIKKGIEMLKRVLNVENGELNEESLLHNETLTTPNSQLNSTLNPQHSTLSQEEEAQ